MSMLEERRSERQRLEALQNQIHTIDAAVEDARRAEESAARVERRARADAKEAYANARSRYEESSEAHYKALDEVTGSKQAIDTLRGEIGGLERRLKKLGVPFESLAAAEARTLMSPEWRELSNRWKQTFGNGVIF